MDLSAVASTSVCFPQPAKPILSLLSPPSAPWVHSQPPEPILSPLSPSSAPLSPSSAPWAHPQPPEPILRVTGLVCPWLRSRGLASVAGVCALVVAPPAALCAAGLLGICFLSLPALCRRGLFVLSAAPRGLCALPKSECLPIGTQPCPLRPHWDSRPALCAASVAHWAALCAARALRAGWVCLPRRPPLSVPARARCLFGGHSPSAVHGLRSAASSVYCPPSPFFAWFSATSKLLFGPRLWESFPVHGNSCCRAPSLPSGTSSCPEVLQVLPFNVSLLSPTSFLGA